MSISLRPENLKRYGDVARLLLRYGNRDLVRRAGLEELIDDEEAEARPEEAPEGARLAEDLEALGPTYVKLGQLLSTRVDLLPAPYTEALARLQDRVEPFPYAEVEEILQQELGVRISKAFLEFDPEPIAAASLGQVHRARLRDGTPVAVKVQRPGIREQVVADLDALEELATFLDEHTEAGRRYEFREMLLEVRRSLLRELDYRREAVNLVTLRRDLAAFDLLVVPDCVEDYSTGRVLTMEYVRGRKITAVSPLRRMEIDGARLADQLFEAYLQQILVDGFFHADPHPGNVFLTDDGRIALLDVGMVGRLPAGLQRELLRLLLAISDGRGEEAAEEMVRIGEPLPEFDARTFEGRIAEIVLRHRDASAGELQVGRVVVEVTRVAGESGLRVPPQLTLLGKTLLNLDQVGRVLDPDFEPNAAVRRHAGKIMQQRLLRSASPGNVVSSMLEMNEFLQRLPARLNRVLDEVSEHGLEMKVHVTNEALMMSGLQKIANRIATGIVLAALIVGAAMLMRVQTSFRILGYPGLAMLLFLAAALGGILMVADVVAHDRSERD